MGSRNSQRTAFTLIEFILGLGLAAVLLLTIIMLGTAALSGDAKSSQSQVASALAENQLEILRSEVATPDPTAHAEFWNAPEGPYEGLGTQEKILSNNTEYTLEYTISIVRDSSGAPLGMSGNQLRQVDLKVSWWEGEKGRPGYGQLFVTRTRLLRESDAP